MPRLLLLFLLISMLGTACGGAPAPDPTPTQAADQTSVPATPAAAVTAPASASTAAPARTAAPLPTGTSTPAPTATTAPSPTPDTSPITIGLLYNTSGPLTAIDRAALNGSLLAVKEINARGGIGGARLLETVVEDGRSDTTAIEAAADTLGQSPDVRAIVGLTDSDYAAVAAPVAQQAGVPLLVVGGTAPSLLAIGDNVFLVAMADNTQGAALAEFAAREQQWKRAAVLTDTKWDYTKTLARAFATRYSQIGGAVIIQQQYSSDNTDISEQLGSILAQDPAVDFVFIAAVPDDVGVLVAKAREAGMTLPILGGDGFDTPLLVEVAGPDAANSVFFATHVGIRGDQTALERFRNEYTEEYGEAPSGAYAMLGYDAVYLLAAAMERAASADPADIRAALAETKEFEGLTGTLSYDDRRNPLKSVALIEMQGGDAVSLEAIVPTQVPAP